MLQLDLKGGRVGIGDRFAVTFRRTLRLPDDGRTYPLPPGLGMFPIRRVEEFAGRLPPSWLEEGGVFLPMYQREALWLGFEAAAWKPNAVKLGVGGINALTGARWDETLRADPQDYMACPPQPWIDGVKVGGGRVRQFIAMPLGSGTTIEAQLAGEERTGGLQLAVFEPRPGRFPDRAPPENRRRRAMSVAPAAVGMGLGAGGLMEQKIYPDPHGVEVWDPDNRGVLRVHIVNSEQYRELTGSDPPPTPVDARAYTARGYPWFALYDEAAGDLDTFDALAGVKSIRGVEVGQGARPAPEAPVDVPEGQIRRLGTPEL